MSDRAYAKAQVQQKTLSGSSPRSSLLQRTRAYGQHTIAGGECSTCRSEQSALLRSQRAFGSSSTSVVTHGNSAAQENVLPFNAAADRASRFGHDFSKIPVYSSQSPVLQTKLKINQPGDIYELEADRLSEQVMRMPEPQLQRACACGGACTKCQTEQPEHGHKSLQTKRVQASDTGQISAPPIVHDVLRSPGQPLDTATRAFMEPRFRHEFSKVRIHTDAQAAESARAVNASAYTIGHNVVFGSGQYASTTQGGRKLMAHELTHVIQQDDNAHAQRRKTTIGPMQDAREREVERVAGLIGAPRAARRIDSPKTPPVLQRQPAPSADDPQKKPGKKEIITPPPQKIPAPEAKQEPYPLKPPDGFKEIQRKAKNVLEPGGIAGGWTRHIFGPPPFFIQNDPIQVGGQWVPQVKQVTPRPPSIQSFYPDVGIHIIAAEGPGAPKYYDIKDETAKLLKQGEQEHIDDHVWAYTHTQKVIEEAINKTASSEPISNEALPGDIEYLKENPKWVVKMITEEAFRSRLPPELRPLNLTILQQQNKWWKRETGVYSKLDDVTKERDVKGWHTLNSHLDSGSGHFVLDTSKTEIGKHHPEDFMKTEYDKLKKEEQALRVRTLIVRQLKAEIAEYDKLKK